MPYKLLTFLIAFGVAFGGTYLFYQSKGTSVSKESEVQPAKVEETTNEENQQPTEVVSVSNAEEELGRLSCLSCHAVSSLGIAGGVTGPDLSEAFTSVEGKHGKPINEYLTEPTSAVMSSVIGGNPLSDEDLEKLLSILKEASESSH